MHAKITPALLLRNRAQAAAQSLLAELREPVDEPIEVAAVDPVHRVEVRILSLTAAAAEPIVGNMFSPLEKCIYDAAVKAAAAEPGRPIKANTIGRLSGQTVDTKFKLLLSNLVDRGVFRRLAHGYALPETVNSSQ
jgi:hypothetical protein